MRGLDCRFKSRGCRSSTERKGLRTTEFDVRCQEFGSARLNLDKCLTAHFTPRGIALLLGHLLTSEDNKKGGSKSLLSKWPSSRRAISAASLHNLMPDSSA